MTPPAFQPLSSDAALGESLVSLGLLGISFYSLQLNKFIYVQILKHLTSILYIEPSPYNKPPCFTKTTDHDDVRETAGQEAAHHKAPTGRSWGSGPERKDGAE